LNLLLLFPLLVVGSMFVEPLESEGFIVRGHVLSRKVLCLGLEVFPLCP